MQLFDTSTPVCYRAPMNDTPSPQAPRFLLDGIRRVLVPLVRLLLHFGITYPMFAELVKRAFVQVAEREFALPDREQTASRLALLTGINRQEINRVRTTVRDDADAPIGKKSAAAMRSPRLLTAWTHHAPFVDETGRPRALHRTTALGEPSFERLVESVAKDIRPRAVLDEWLRLGIVTQADDGLLRLEQSVFVPHDSLPDKTRVATGILHDHLAASVHNLRGGEPFFDRRVRVEGLTPDALRELRDLVRTSGTEFLQSVNARADRLASGEAQGPTHRMTIGLFEYEERESDATDVPPR